MMAPYIRLVETCCFYMLMCGTAPVNAPAVRGFKLRKGTVGRYGAARLRQSHKSILSDKFNFLCELFHILRRVLYRIYRRRRRPLYHTSFNFIRTLRNDKNSIFTHTNTRARHRSGLEIHLQFDCRFPSLKLSYVYIYKYYFVVFSISSSFSAHF